jgi:TRAP-type C4-dicarboxylate transport system substrate-binding protein
LALAAAFIGVAMSAPAQETRLLLTSLSPAGSPNSAFFNEWAQRVGDIGKGSVKVEVRDGTALANFSNSYDRVLSDVVQIGWAQHAFVAGKFPLSEVPGLPFLVDDNVACSVTLWRLYRTGLLEAEYKETVPVWFGCLGQQGLHFAKAPRSIDDLGGLKLRVAGKVPSRLVELMGGTPISMPAENMYEALQRGTLDGLVTSWAAFEPYKLHEVSSYHLEAAVGTSPSMFFMARKKFESLPAEARHALEANSGEGPSRAFGAHIANQAARARTPVAASDKHRLVQLTPQQRAAWEAKASPILEDWTKERAGGDKVVAAFRTIYAEVKASR